MKLQNMIHNHFIKFLLGEEESKRRRRHESDDEDDDKSTKSSIAEKYVLIHVICGLSSPLLDLLW